MKVAIVVQRYGADINGGAELHARYVAERLARHADVRVLTTCARDYLTWRNELPPGADTVNGIAVERFPVDHERSEEDFGLRSTHVFMRRHSLNEELAWLDSEGPASRSLIGRLPASPRKRTATGLLKGAKPSMAPSSAAATSAGRIPMPA